ncbi:brachyurin-like [Zophobas morio]|uniref:brachyurin-like n=1 Tax=Zophobas morio TaxID=2755281 RepID=UPI0030830483
MRSTLVILVLCFCRIWSSSLDDERIIDGAISSDGQFPYAVAFYYFLEDGRHFCGGSLLDDKSVLTAAHCLEGGTQFVIHLGINKLGEAEDSGLVINSTSYVIHPDYNGTVLNNDIGILYLETTISFSDKIQPVELPTEALGPNEDVFALGWGSVTDEQLLPSNDLSHVSLTTISNAVCRRTYGDFIQNNMVCLVGIGNQGICDGDSGSPLIQIAFDGRNIQVGVASFFGGLGCETEHPSGYTRTFEYVEWIRNVIAPESTPEPEPTLAPGSASIITSLVSSVMLLLLVVLYL